METLQRRAPIDTVMFDFAGTLVDGVPNWEYPQIVACAEAGREVSPAEVKAAIWKVWGPLEGCTHVAASVDEATYARWIGAVERQILANLDVPEHALERATARVMELQVAPECYRLYPEVPATLEALRARGVPLGLISNFAWGLPDLVAVLGIAQYFDAIVTSAREGYRKPRPEIFQNGLALLGATPERVLFVGDDPECDYLGAQSLGLRPLLIDRKGRGGEGMKTVTDLREITRWLGTG